MERDIGKLKIVFLTDHLEKTDPSDSTGDKGEGSSGGEVF